MSEEERAAKLAFTGGHVELLPDFDDARVEFRRAFTRCGDLRIPTGSATAAAMTELLPHLTAAYGPERTAFLLRKLAEAVVAETPAPSWQ